MAAWACGIAQRIASRGLPPGHHIDRRAAIAPPLGYAVDSGRRSFDASTQPLRFAVSTRDARSDDCSG